MVAVLLALCALQAAACGQSGTQSAPATLPPATPAESSLPSAPHSDPLLLQNVLLLLGPQPIKGPNFTLDILSVHSSVTGWAEVWTPGLSYRLNRRLSIGAMLPWYWNVKNHVPVTDKTGTTTYPLMATQDVIGDLALYGQFEAELGKSIYLFTASGGAPTGQSRFGLSANAPTYNVTNHVERIFDRFTLAVEAGEGDSTSLATSASTKKSYVAVGPVANFMAGGSIELPRRMNLDLDAFEQLPIGDQNVYGTVTKKVKGKNVTTQVLEGTGVAEDNGFQAELDLPLCDHLILTGNYERSLRQAADTTGIGLMWVLRAPQKLKLPYLAPEKNGLPLYEGR